MEFYFMSFFPNTFFSLHETVCILHNQDVKKSKYSIHIDMVIVFQKDTPLKLLHALRPDVLIKGSNYRPVEVIGADIVKKYSGEIYLANVMNVVNYNKNFAVMTSEAL